MSTMHLLDTEGATACGASPRDDGSNVTSARSFATCETCLSLPDGIGLDEEQHVDYPHFPGRLYDCPACEAKCHCKAGETECVFEGEHNGLAEA